MLVNYNYNVLAARIDTAKNIEVSVKLISKLNSSQTQVVLSSPDYLERQILEYSINEDYINFVIPNIEIYDLVYISANSSAPQIINFFPPNDTTIVEKDTLLFNVTATDLDNNHLHYDWFINGKIDTSAISNSYFLKTSYESSGIDTIKVVVSDGQYQISHSWIITIEDKPIPRILFDETHDEERTLSYEKSLQIYPDHPEWTYCGELIKATKDDYIWKSYSEGILHLDTLKNYDILIFMSPRKNLINNTMDAVERYVYEGGNLFLMGCYPQSNINYLVNRFGFAVDYTSIAAQNHDWDFYSFGITNLSNHYITKNVDRFQVNYTNSANLYSFGDALSIIRTDSTTWRDYNYNQIKDMNEPIGPFNILVVSRYGKGKIVYLGDDSFYDAFLASSFENRNLILNILSWLGNDESMTSVSTATEILPIKFNLYQNYPNPFNSVTTIKYQLPKEYNVSIIIFDLLGRQVKTLIDKAQNAGFYTISWDGKNDLGLNVSSGIYFIKFETESYVKIRKAIIIK